MLHLALVENAIFLLYSLFLLLQLIFWIRSYKLEHTQYLYYEKLNNYKQIQVKLSCPVTKTGPQKKKKKSEFNNTCSSFLHKPKKLIDKVGTKFCPNVVIIKIL